MLHNPVTQWSSDSPYLQIKCFNMVKLEIVEQTNRALVRSRSLVAVFVGAAQGTGEYALRELSKIHGTEGKGLRAFLVARNEGLAETILRDCKEVCPNGHFRYVKAGDLSLLRDVDAVCELLGTALREDMPGSDTPHIDILCLTQSISRFGPPTCECLPPTLDGWTQSRLICAAQSRTKASRLQCLCTTILACASLSTCCHT